MTHPSDEEIGILSEVRKYGHPKGARGYQVSQRRIDEIQRHVFGFHGIGGCSKCQALMDTNEEFLDEMDPDGS